MLLAALALNANRIALRGWLGCQRRINFHAFPVTQPLSVVVELKPLHLNGFLLARLAERDEHLPALAIWHRLAGRRLGPLIMEFRSAVWTVHRLLALATGLSGETRPRGRRGRSLPGLVDHRWLVGDLAPLFAATAVCFAPSGGPVIVEPDAGATTNLVRSFGPSLHRHAFRVVIDRGIARA